MIGRLDREGQLYSQEAGIEVFDHDWSSLADGIAIPHGLYDLALNIGSIQIGTSHDTSQFACDAIRQWWKQSGSVQYPTAGSILLLCAGCGSNSSPQYLFKQDLQALVTELGIEIRLAHYPPYTSKSNPIEHRLFPHLTRVCQGMIFESVEMVQDLMAKAKTQTGLKVFSSLFNQVYETGRKVTQQFNQTIEIVFDDYLPRWNYTANPQTV